MDIVVPGNSQLHWSIIGSDMPSALCLVYVCVGLYIGFQNDSITNAGEKHVVEKEGNSHNDQNLTGITLSTMIY